MWWSGTIALGCLVVSHDTAATREPTTRILTHVFGHKGEIIPENVRLPMLTAIARAQLIILASRGRREYTKSELSQIYDNGYVEVFKALEFINHVHQDSKYAAALAKHDGNPRNNPPPKRFKSMRYYDNHAHDNHLNLLLP